MTLSRAADILKMDTLADVTRLQSAAIPERTALRFEGEDISYLEFDRRTEGVASALRAANIGYQDRIAYLGKNTARYFEILFGAAKIGAVLVPVNWRLAGPEIEYILKDSKAKMLFVGGEFHEVAEDIVSKLDDAPLLVGLEDGPGLQKYSTWRDESSFVEQTTKISPEDVALQLYTSGTTGRPKGAMLTHQSLFGLRKTAREEVVWDRWYEEEVMLISMPLFHIAGSANGIQLLRNGGTGVIVREFDVHKVLDLIEQERISRLFLVPSALQIIVRSPGARQIDYSRIRCIRYGAAPIPLELLRECMDVFGCGFAQLYGMTETSGSIVALAPEDHDPNGSPRMRSAGKALPGVEIAIMGEDGRKLPAHEVGEIVTRSAANMKGYWNMPDATLATLDSDGWLRTGDAGYLDDDGYLYIHDRVKDMIVSGGENVYPAEVENAIFGHPDVLEVAVIGVPDDKWGEAVKALVVLRAGKSLSDESILNWARARIAGYKVPKSVEVIDVLPRNASGKVLRRELREPYWSGRRRRVN